MSREDPLKQEALPDPPPADHHDQRGHRPRRVEELLTLPVTLSTRATEQASGSAAGKSDYS